MALGFHPEEIKKKEEKTITTNTKTISVEQSAAR